MPTWGALLKELGSIKGGSGESNFDALRRSYLKKLAAKTGRNVIAYTTAWTSQPNGAGPAGMLSIEDVQGFMEVMHGLTGDQLDLVLHSPGGSPEATEAVVVYLRQKFKHIRVIVPHAAMSAATMLACASNEIVLGKHSFMGPIDPQLVLRVEGQLVQAPAAAIKEQFAEAQREIQADPSKLPAWIPILKMFGPALLAQCRHAEDLSRELVGEWLAKWMFAGEADAGKKAKEIAGHLALHANFKSHNRYLPRDKIKGFGLKVLDLEDDQELQDLALSVFHAATITHSSTAVIKIIENHLGRCYLKQDRSLLVQQPGASNPLQALLKQLQPSPTPAQPPAVQPTPTPPPGALPKPPEPSDK
jgi:hypothetical protein